MPFGGLLSAGIGAGASILGGVFGKSSAQKQSKAVKQQAIDVAHSIEKATGGAIEAGYQGINQANTALRGGLADATSAINTGVAGGNQALADAYAQQRQDIQQYNPYIQAGGQGLTQLQAFMAPGGAGTKPFTADMMSSYDPGYAFRLQQGEQALQKSAAARGASLGGGAQKALARYSQDYASGEYSNAFNRYMAGQQQQYNMLSGLAGMGLGATNAAVNLGVGAAGNYGRGVSGNIMTGAGGLAQANLGVGSQLANTAMQGNEWIGTQGMTGAEAAGNLYMGGAIGSAAGNMAGTNALWQGIGGGAGAIGGGLLNKYNPWNNQVWSEDWNAQGAPDPSNFWGQYAAMPQAAATVAPQVGLPQLQAFGW